LCGWCRVELWSWDWRLWPWPVCEWWRLHRPGRRIPVCLSVAVHRTQLFHRTQAMSTPSLSQWSAMYTWWTLCWLYLPLCSWIHRSVPTWSYLKLWWMMMSMIHMYATSKQNCWTLLSIVPDFSAIIMHVFRLIFLYSALVIALLSSHHFKHVFNTTTNNNILNLCLHPPNKHGSTNKNKNEERNLAKLNCD